MIKYCLSVGICRRITSILVALGYYALGLIFVLPLSSCKTISNSGLKTDNGVEIVESHPIFYSLVRLKNLTSPNWRCTGTLVTRKLVVTAAHCLEGKDLTGIVLEIGGDDYAIKRMLAFREQPYVLSMNFDVAWVELDRDTPQHYPSISILRDIAKVQDSSLLLAGFEVTSNGQWKKTGAPHKLVEFVHKPHIRSIMVLDKSGAASGTPGDSGGPTYVEINGKWFLVGITHGIHPVMARREGDYHVLSTFAGYYFDWFEKTSGETLSYLGTSNPVMDIQDESAKLAENFDEACNSWNHEEPNWLAIQKLADQAAYFTFGSEKYSYEQARNSLLNCTVMKAQLSAQIEEEDGKLDVEPFVHSFEKKGPFRFHSFEALTFSSNIRELQIYSDILPSFKNLCMQSEIKSLFLRKHSAVSKVDIVGNIDSRLLAACSNLRKLWIEGFKLRDLTSLKTIPTLEDFAGTIQNAGRIQFPDNLASLKSLILANSQITDISEIYRLKKLESLNLDGNMIEDLSPLASLSNLRELSIAGNPITNCPKNSGPKILRDFCSKP